MRRCARTASAGSRARRRPAGHSAQSSRGGRLYSLRAMEHEEDRSVSLGTELSASVPPPSPLSGCYLLAVLGEPHTQQHKEIILQRLVKAMQVVCSARCSRKCQLMIVSSHSDSADSRWVQGPCPLACGIEKKKERQKCNAYLKVIWFR
ncbi:Microtubule-associated protein futsch [Eumeta japonica]|uniref:Microtubule-associated protein futsch n=1 Tax=Eumeta variegata TaxID=151549 RepID=A0A4C1TXD9_EUMVA|nr:Microtubule-associated protein futsch [Eumeta japonica]